jgi:hypothetical protein
MPASDSAIAINLQDKLSLVRGPTERGKEGGREAARRSEAVRRGVGRGRKQEGRRQRFRPPCLLPPAPSDTPLPPVNILQSSRTLLSRSRANRRAYSSCVVRHQLPARLTQPPAKPIFILPRTGAEVRPRATYDNTLRSSLFAPILLRQPPAPSSIAISSSQVFCLENTDTSTTVQITPPSSP